MQHQNFLLSKYQKARLKGCILGGAIGDSFGYSFENKNPPLDISIQDSIWRISDDTQLTLATCESLLTSHKVNPEHIANTFKKWFNQNKISGIGASTLKALRELQVGGHWALVGRKGEFSAGNGAAMRIAPLAFFVDTECFENRLIIRDICRITHHNEEAYSGALAVILAIKYFLTSTTPSKTEYFSYILNNLPDSNTRDILATLSKELNGSINDIGRKYGASGYVAESVPFALFSAANILNNNFTDILIETISVGGDTDTNCSITGQIIGAYLSQENLPSELMHKLIKIHNYSLIENILQLIN